MTDYLRRAVELADGWSVTPDNCVITPEGRIAHPSESEMLRDALAAQLMRQCDRNGCDNIVSLTEVEVLSEHPDPNIGYECLEITEVEDGDRTMATIKAIVDSGVLDTVENRE